MLDPGGQLAGILAEMQRYYDLRAPEYDEWFCRLGRYRRDRTPGVAERWRTEAAAAQAVLRNLAPVGDVLELAAGTGIWTGLLAETADHVHAIDGSAEALAVNRAKHANRRNITYTQADLFGWQSDRQYDLVAACFWLSHVHPVLLDGHLKTIRRALKPGGGLFTIDSALSPNSSASDHPPQKKPDHLVTRKLNDGSEHRIVKVFYEPGELETAFARANMRIRIRLSGEFFHYAATRNADLQ